MSGRKHFTCTVPGCGRPHCAGGFCNTHYARSRRRTGLEPERALANRTGPRSGPTNAKWKGFHIRKDGYVMLRMPDHPMAGQKSGYVMRHRLLKAEQIGRLLTADEVVHHRRSTSGSDDPSDTELLPGHREHAKIHAEHYEFRGESHTIPEWAALFNLSRRTVNGRLKKGWSLERALTTRPGPSRSTRWRST